MPTVDVALQSFLFDTVPGPSTKKGMQAAALIATRKRKLAEAAGPPPAAAAGGGVVPPGAAADVEQVPAKRPKLEGTA